MAETPTAIEATQSRKKEGLVRGFVHFISQYGILPLAIGVVVGNAVNDLVKSLVDGLITPFISLIAPEAKLQTIQFVFRGSTFKVGMVINAVLSFLVVALVVYFGVRVILRRDELLAKK